MNLKKILDYYKDCDGDCEICPLRSILGGCQLDDTEILLPSEKVGAPSHKQEEPRYPDNEPKKNEQSPDEVYNVYGSKLKDVYEIERLNKLIDKLYKEIGILHCSIAELSGREG